MIKEPFDISLFLLALVETAIVDFMDYWRSTWPRETVTPKMHMLEEHMVPFLKKWKLGCGFYGEQGKLLFQMTENKTGYAFEDF